MNSKDLFSLLFSLCPISVNARLKEKSHRQRNQQPDSNPRAHSNGSLPVMLIFEQAGVLESSERWREEGLLSFQHLFHHPLLGTLFLKRAQTSYYCELGTAEDGVGIKV